MSENKMICPECNKELNKVDIDYIASINKTFDIEGKTLYWNTFDDEVNINDVYMVYCSKCGSELPHEMRREILENFNFEY